MALRKIALMHRIFGVCEGHACRECSNLVKGRYHDRILTKCKVYGLTHSEASDWAGRWEKWNGDDRHHCTVCECYANAERDSYGYIAYEFLDNYCPNCGAKMDLEEQNGKSKNDRLFQASNAE